MATRPRISRQTVDVLAELLRTPGKWRYGYDLMKVTGVAAGTLYPILARLADAGWLASEWDRAAEDGRPPRQNYRLTPSGRAGAREMIARASALNLAEARP